jgi:hypothetical protein
MASGEWTCVRDEDGEWEGWYRDGELVIEDDDLDQERVLGAMAIKYDFIYTKVPKGSSLPKKLEDVKSLQDLEWERLRKRVNDLRTEADTVERSVDEEMARANG